VSRLEFRPEFWHPKTGVRGLSYGVICVIPSFYSRFGTVPACDRRTDEQTDGQTDGRTHDDRIYCASIASRGKNDDGSVCTQNGIWRHVGHSDTASTQFIAMLRNRSIAIERRPNRRIESVAWRQCGVKLLLVVSVNPVRQRYNYSRFISKEARHGS